jgi:phospholipid-binding lipoprotein MlaA
MAMVGPEQLIPGQTPESSSEGGTPWWAEDQTQSVSADDPDPLEPINRVIFGFNQVVDGILLKPIAILYHDTLPDMARTGVTNFMENLFAPVTFGNNLLQAEAEDAARTFFRFVINSTFGMLGLIDAAKEMGVPAKPATLNQTFAKWGVETGPYLVLPLLGPSSFRGTYGTIGEWFMNPWTYMVQNKHRRYNHHGQQRTLLYMLYGLDIVNRRAKLIAALNDLEKSSLDLYATIRSIYFQKQKEMEQSLKSKKEESRETDSTFRKQQAELGGATMFN